MSELASDAEVKTPNRNSGVRLRIGSFVVIIAVLFAGILVAALFDLESRSRAWDAHAELATIDRVDSLGGSYYTTGTDHKGPLWLGFYSLADKLSGPQGLWFAVSGLIIAIAVVTGAAASVAGYLASGNWPGAVVGGIGVTTFLVLGNEEYSNVLYSRNITSALTALAFALLLLQLLRAERWGSNLAIASISGGLVGMAIQTMPTSIITAIVFLGWIVLQDHSSKGTRRLIGPLSARATVWAASAVIVGSSAHIYYLAKGLFGDFWSYWYTYNTFYSEATGRSFTELVYWTIARFGYYYVTHPLLLIIGLLFVGGGMALWRVMTAPERLAWVGLVAWYVAELGSVAVAQRFFPHYFVLTFVPVAFMATIMLARSVASPSRSVRWTLPSLLLLTLVLGTSVRLAAGLERAIAFESLENTADDHIRRLPGWEQVQRSIIALTVNPDEPILVWHRQAHFYTDFERMSATRFIENRWLAGEIGGASTSPDFVLHGTFDKFADDLNETSPVALVDFPDATFPARVERIIESSASSSYVEVLNMDGPRLRIARSRLTELKAAFAPIGPAAENFIHLSPDTGWHWSGEELVWSGGKVPETDLAIFDTGLTCFAVTGEVNRVSGPFQSFVAAGRFDPGLYHAVTLSKSSAVSEYRNESAFVALGATTVGTPEWSTFTAYVNERHLLLMVDGRIVGAVEASPGTSGFALRPWTDEFRVRDLQVLAPVDSAWNPCTD